jgi:hypothetical protein
MTRDPHQVLGLAPGASAAEVKRVYRRLAKEHHPDSAGEGALPRFLEIQRAYEQLTSASWRPEAGRPAPTEPWRADPARARSTPGARPPGERTRGAAPAGARAPGGGPEGGAPGTAPGGARSRPGATGGPRPKSGPGTRREGATGRRRPVKKATFGSTTYDEAHDPADPAWSGASWYGPTSGEYWQVNPREYADPRKHGPEYLARAAARAATATERRSQQAEEDSPGPPGPGEPELARRDRPRTSAAAPGTGPAPDAASGGVRSAPQTQAPHRPSWSAGQTRRIEVDRATADAAFEAAGTAAPGSQETAETPGTAGATADVATATGATGSTNATADAGTAGPGITRRPGVRRIVGAAVAWPPLGIAAAALIGEATGCAAFEASCTAPAHLYPWFAQAAILLGLLAAPGVSRLLAGGTAAVVILAFPVAAALSAGGATYDRARGPAALIAVLAVAWAVGVAAMVLRRSARRPTP